MTVYEVDGNYDLLDEVDVLEQQVQELLAEAAKQTAWDLWEPEVEYVS